MHFLALSSVAQAGQRLNPARQRYLREWRVRDLDENRLRVAEMVSSRPELVSVTSAVAGWHIGAVDQHEPATDGLLEIGNMQAQCFPDYQSDQK